MLEQVRLGPVLEEQEGRGEDVPVQEMELEGQRPESGWGSKAGELG